MATIQMSYYSTCLDRIVPVTAVIPLEPGPGGKVRNGSFPSVYLLHGYSGFCTDWLQGARVAELAARYEVAVFCPSGENAFYLNDEGTNDRDADQIGQELVEVTRALFPLSAKKEDTILAGFSMGGYGALRNGLWYDDTFGSIFAFSCALITDQLASLQPGDEGRLMRNREYYRRCFGDFDALAGSDKDVEALARRYVEKHGSLPEIYQACGTEDFLVEANRKFARCMQALPGRTLYEEWPGVHDWNFWNTAIEKAFAWWQQTHE